MKIKKGDKVQVITGAYKGTIGEVTKVFPKEDKVIVEGVNLVKKHLKPTGESGWRNHREGSSDPCIQRNGLRFQSEEGKPCRL